MHGGHHLSAERKAELVATAAAMSQSGKGLTACDEGPGTIGDRFEKVGITNSEENRRLYRQMLFTVANGDQFLSGAILDPETVYQKTDGGVLFPELLTSRGIVPGVKPHLKIYELPGCKPGETVMQVRTYLQTEYRSLLLFEYRWGSSACIILRYSSLY